MKRARNVFRGAVVEGFGALIFLMIVAVSLPNLLSSPENAGPQPVGETTRPAILREVPKQEQIQKRPVRDWFTSLRQAVYEEPVEKQQGASRRFAPHNVVVPNYDAVASQRPVNRHAVYWEAE